MFLRNVGILTHRGTGHVKEKQTRKDIIKKKKRKPLEKKVEQPRASKSATGGLYDKIYGPKKEKK